MLNQKIKQYKVKKKRGPLKAILITLLVLFVLIIGILVFVVNASLNTDFMVNLPLFEELTVLNYGQQIQSPDIEEHQRETIDDTNQWYASVEREKLEITSADGYKLIGMEFKQPESNTSHNWALVLHGYTGWKEEMYEFARWYHKQGYSVIVPDLRCQGESDGDFIGMGLTDSTDCMRWLEIILDQDPQAEIVLHGQSMGAATALIMSGRADLPTNVVAVVSDAAYTDAYTMFGRKLKDWFHVPAFPIVDGASLMIQFRAGYSLKDAAPLEFVPYSDIPTLFIHGKEDAMIDVDMAYELFEAEAAYKELLIVEGAGHAQTQYKNPDNYYDTIEAFIEKAKTIRK